MSNCARENQCAARSKQLPGITSRSSEKAIDWFDDSSQTVYEIRNFIEFKTTWHPIGA